MLPLSFYFLQLCLLLLITISNEPSTQPIIQSFIPRLLHLSGMDASELLKTQTIHYLHPETIRSFSELLILSAEGRRFSLNPLVLFSKSPLLRDLFLEEEELLSDRVLLTNIPEADLEVVLESLVKGEEVFSPLRIQGVKSALEALGLSKDSQGGHSFTYKDEPIKMELQDDAQETTHIKEEQQDGEEAGGLVVAIVAAAAQENNSPTEARHLQNNSQEETDPLMLVKPTLQCINCGQYNNIDSERNHASSNPFHTPECNHPDCEDRFSSYSEHLDHVKSAHEGQFHFKCGLCGDLFPDVPSFTSHKKAVHHASTKRKISDRSALINKEKSVCKLCGKRLLRCNMTAHIKIVHGNDPVNCSICNKTFNHPMALKLHGDSTHREFPCGKCGDMCRSPKAYKQHILTKHTPPELLPYQCVDCGKAFTTAYMFKQHENMHRGIKPHASTVSFIMPGGRPRTPSADEKEEKRKERKRNWATKQRKKERGEEEEKDIDVGKAQRGRPRKAGGTAEEETKRQIEREKKVKRKERGNTLARGRPRKPEGDGKLDKKRERKRNWAAEKKTKKLKIKMPFFSNFSDDDDIVDTTPDEDR